MLYRPRGKNRAPAGATLARLRVLLCRDGPSSLLNLNLGADFLELLLDRLGLVLRDGLLDRLRGALDEVLGFLETEGGDLADDLDHVDLVGADFLQRDCEFRLLLSRSRRAAGGARHAARKHR